MENKWFNNSIKETEKILQTNIKKGLTSSQVEEHRENMELTS